MSPNIKNLSRIEPLESRIAPATLVNPTTVTYDDIDGDHVTVTVSKGDLTGKLTFVTAFNDPGHQQLLTINLASPQFSGADLKLSVVTSGGDGAANFGVLNAKGVDLGNVILAGSVNKILAGDGKKSTPGLGNLTLVNLGAGSNLGAPDFVSIINGPVGDVNMNNVNQAYFSVTGGAMGTIKSIHAGNLFGGTAPFSGSISTTGNMGPVNVSVLEGASGDNSGQILIGGNADDLIVNAALDGGSGKASGAIVVKGSSSFLFAGFVEGGSGAGSGSVSVMGAAKEIDAKSITGGAGLQSARIFVQGNIGGVFTNTIMGGSGDFSGAIVGGAAISSIDLSSSGSSLVGGTGLESGRIRAAGLLGSVTIEGALQGGAGDFSGSIRSDKGLPSISIGGSVKSGFGAGSGSIVTNGNVGAVSIGGDVTGSIGAPVVISALGKLKLPAGATTNITIDSVTVGGDVKFLNLLAGYDITGKALNADAQINSISIAKTVTGSNFVAGIAAGKDGLFGTADDVAIKGGSASILAKIASIIITKQTVSTVDPSDAFGVVAQQVSSASVNGAAIALTAGPSNDKGIALGAADDFKLREI